LKKKKFGFKRCKQHGKLIDAIVLDLTIVLDLLIGLDPLIGLDLTCAAVAALPYIL